MPKYANVIFSVLELGGVYSVKMRKHLRASLLL